MKNVFLITPSSLIRKKRDFSGGTQSLFKLGFNVLNPEFPTALSSPQEKAAQIHRAFSDPDVEMILAQRGGYGAMKSLPFIDFDLIREHPRFFAGFSDVSALLNPIFERTGLVTFHAPMVKNLSAPTPFTLKSFLNAVSGFPEKNLFKGAPVKVFHPGIARGILKGGNLMTLSALMGTDWEIDTEHSILFLEDVDEKSHSVDRCLTQWILAGKFRDVQAILLGDFRGIRSRQVYEMIASQMEIKFPVVSCSYIGHGDNKMTLPVGALVELDTDRKRLFIQEMSLPGGIP
ncbi:muramoyltetrapeptide carboxypeptidase [Syntrophus gentianae]|uniref:Muramoyltetrapeptide carboxypeptidase n=1 Tax=Syntrophus gentianae TaxID=43775 RepID=A0A1H7VDU8_9BACT|nr:LD-carboxypeptidase [Syntrophus gentianae]SEM07413.1 muramoyltetrapeptide carboxypeptidase [Syntrophus gentianae]